MSFKIIPTKFFLKQLEELDDYSKAVIKSKKDLLKINPFRYKKVHSKKYRVYRIRMNLQNKETRLIYAILEPRVIIVCLIDRKKDYKNLEKFLRKYLYRTV